MTKDMTNGNIPGCLYQGCRTSALPTSRRCAGECCCKSEINEALKLIKILKEERDEYRDCSVYWEAESEKLKDAARALLKALPNCGCRGAARSSNLCITQHHHDEIQTMEGAL